MVPYSLYNDFFCELLLEVALFSMIKIDYML
jgi:hypothetical protein